MRCEPPHRAGGPAIGPARGQIDRAKARGVVVHSDAVQAVGHLDVDFGATGLDALSLSAHKFGGPTGVGALVISRDLQPEPLLHGGGQERSFRSGTLDVASIAGMATALDVVMANREQRSERIDRDDEFSQANDPRYAWLPPEANPLTECLADVVQRLVPYWQDVIVPDLRAGKVTLVAAHGNSLRALVKHLDGISNEDIVGLNIPTGIPLVYRLDADLRPTVRGGEYLDADAAAAAIEAVKNQGR